MHAIPAFMLACTSLASFTAAIATEAISPNTVARQQQDEDADREIIRQYSAAQGRWLALHVDRNNHEQHRKAILDWIDKNAAALFMEPSIMKQSFLAHADKIYTDEEIARLEAACHEFDELYEQVRHKKQAEQDARYLRQRSREPGMTVLPNGILYKATVSREGENLPVAKTRIVEISTSSGFMMGTMYVSPADGLSSSIREILPQLPPALEWQIIVPVKLLDKVERERASKFATIAIYTLKILGPTPNDHLEPRPQTPTSLQP